MKIGIVCYPSIGGSGIVATELGKALSMLGHQAHFIAYQEPVRLNNFDQRIRFHKVEISQYPLFHYQPYELSLTSKIVETVKEEKLDVLHVHYAIPHAAAAYTAQHILSSEGIHIPYITTLHGTDITLLGKSNAFKSVIRFAINQSNAITAVSENLRQDTLKLFNTKKPIHVIPNFIDLNEYQLPPNEDLKKSLVGDCQKVICHTSNFRKVKRIEDVITVFSGITKVFDAKLLLIGDGPEHNKIKNLVKEEDLCEKVLFLGKVADVISLLKLSDLFLLTSENESFGLSLLEAMACSSPAVSTNTGGIPEVNQNGISGFLSDVGDTESMTNQAIEILTHPDKFRKGALATAKKFNRPDVLPLYLSIYESLTKSK